MSLRKWGITALSCVLIFAALAAFKVLEIRAAIAFGESFPEHSESVELAVVATTQYTPAIRVIGEMVAPQRLDLRNELAG
ncbi:MAG TPA: efflux transporter periplasmic adaptor subunit, partial [Gammaproteobacteria bacterium]|nr:efflux transporter periplasmic adaptor subunit [Gammaproteobacteria bacterium]